MDDRYGCRPWYKLSSSSSEEEDEATNKEAEAAKKDEERDGFPTDILKVLILSPALGPSIALAQASARERAQAQAQAQASARALAPTLTTIPAPTLTPIPAPRAQTAAFGNRMNGLASTSGGAPALVQPDTKLQISGPSNQKRFRDANYRKHALERFHQRKLSLNPNWDSGEHENDNKLEERKANAKKELEKQIQAEKANARALLMDAKNNLKEQLSNKAKSEAALKLMAKKAKQKEKEMKKEKKKEANKKKRAEAAKEKAAAYAAAIADQCSAKLILKKRRDSLPNISRSAAKLKMEAGQDCRRTKRSLEPGSSKPVTKKAKVIKEKPMPQNSIMGQKVTAERAKGRSTNVSTIVSIKRDVMMPALRRLNVMGATVIDDPLNLEVNIKNIRTYSSMALDVMSNLYKLAQNIQSGTYRREVDVIMVRYEAAQYAWMWNNGSILVCNARSKQLLTDTENYLASKILEGIQPPFDIDDFNLGALHNHLISVAIIPWWINIYRFSQLYGITSDTVMGSSRFAYYVHKTLPRVAAKVYESGMIHVFAMTTEAVDAMVIHLYRLIGEDPTIQTDNLEKAAPA